MNDIKDILVLARAGRPYEPLFSTAAALARRCGAFVQGLCAFEEPELELSDWYAIGPDATGEVLGHRAGAVRAATLPVESSFRAAFEDLKCDWALLEPDEPAETTAMRARCVDLVVMPTPNRHQGAGVGLAETLVQLSAVPCLVAPAKAVAADFPRVLIAWNGSREARRAVEAAAPFLRTASAVEILSADKRLWPGVGPAALARHLAAHDIHCEIVETSRPHGSRAGLILDRCGAFDASLLVMGAFSHARVGEDLVGGTTRSILLEGALPVLMTH